MILIAVISLGAIGAIGAVFLYAASKKFEVYEDPRIAEAVSYTHLPPADEAHASSLTTYMIYMSTGIKSVSR